MRLLNGMIVCVEIRETHLDSTRFHHPNLIGPPAVPNLNK